MMRKGRSRGLLLILLAEPVASFVAITTQLPLPPLLPPRCGHLRRPPLPRLLDLSQTPSIRSYHSHDPSYNTPLPVPLALSASSLFSSSLPTTSSESTPDDTSGRPLDRILSRLTLGFPLYVLLAALSGIYRPSLLEWVNQGYLITILLSSVMWGTGLTLQADDFRQIPPKIILFGVACQFFIMPFSAWLVANLWLKQYSDLFLGLCLVGCAPGGTASNLVSLIANADVALSVALTSCSTLLAVVVTPALVKLLVSGSNISISGMALVQATAKVVFVPVMLGMLMKAATPRLADSISRFTPFCSALLVAIICGGVVAQNTSQLMTASSSLVSFLPRVVVSVLSLHSLGFFCGYFLPRWWLTPRQQPPKTARTISIEVGMQNSALAVVLARSITDSAAAALPGAISATAHSCLGSILAAIWRIQDEKQKIVALDKNTKPDDSVTPQILPLQGVDDPEFSI